jgi:biopolymer transport protein ExbD
MGMSSSGGGDSHSAPKADINTTPLVDVMLVLLIIFMITAPLMADKVKVDLPIATSGTESEEESQAPKVTVSIVSEGGQAKYYWGEQVMTMDTLKARMVAEATKTQNKIRMKIRADAECKYEDISRLLKLSKDSGIQHVSFVSHPERGS